MNATSGGGALAFSVFISSKFDGQAGITQTYDDQSFPVSYGSDVLDMAPFYPYGSGTILVHSAGAPSRNLLTLIDRPWEGCAAFSTTLAVQFRDYIRYRPDAGNRDENVFVTLGKANWGVQANATYDVDLGWSLTPGWSVSAPALTDSTEWPFWKTVVAH